MCETHHDTIWLQFTTSTIKLVFIDFVREVVYASFRPCFVRTPLL